MEVAIWKIQGLLGKEQSVDLWKVLTSQGLMNTRQVLRHWASAPAHSVSGIYLFFKFLLCCMNNKYLETDIGVQAKDEKSKAASHWLLPLSQTEMGKILFPQILILKTEPDTCLLPLYMPL